MPGVAVGDWRGRFREGYGDTVGHWRGCWTACGGRHMLRGMPRQHSPVPERHVRLFRNGRSQAVRIPRQFELPGQDAIMRKEGRRLVIEPAPPRSLLALLKTLRPIDEDFPTIEDPAPDSVEI